MCLSRLILVSLNLFALALVAAGCGGGGGSSSTGPTGPTVQVKLQMDNPGPPVGPTYHGTATIITTAIGADGRGVEGRAVAMSTTRGSLSPTTGTTNAQGQFSSTFRADSEPPGTFAAIMATIDGVTYGIFVSIH